MKKSFIILIVVSALMPQLSVALPNTQVVTVSYVQGAYDELDAIKQNVIDSTHQLDADYVDDSTSTNKFFDGVTTTGTGVVTYVAANGNGIAVTKGDAIVNVKNASTSAVTGTATIWVQ